MQLYAEHKKEEQQLRSDGPSGKRWRGKPVPKPASPEKPVARPKPEPEPQPAISQGYQMPYANGQPATMYAPFYMPNPSAPQGYSSFSYYYGAYPPSRPPQYR